MSRATFALAVSVVTWGSAFPGIRLALAGYTPAQVAFLRYAVAGLLLAGYAAGARVRLPPLRDSLRIGLLGVLGIAAYNVLLAQGQRHVPSGTASLLVASAPMWMVAFAALFAGERPGARGLGGTAVGFAGVALIAAGQGGGFGLETHALVILGAAASGGIYSVLLRPYAQRYGTVPALLVSILGATLALLPWAAGAVHSVDAAPRGATLAVVFLGVVPGVVGYAAWTYASTRASTAATGAALYLVPVFSLVLAYLFLGEIPSVAALGGGALVLAGVVVVQQGGARPALAAPSSEPQA